MTDRSLDKTLHLLAQTDNRSAVGVLAGAMNSGDAKIREEAIRGLLTRREEAGHRQVLRQWHEFDDRCKSTAADFPGRLFTPIRNDVAGGDVQLAGVACDAALWTADYDLAPVLVMIAEDPTNACADLAAKTLLQLTEKLFEAAHGPRDYRDRRDPHMMRARVCSNLESALDQQQLRRVESIESFLQLCQPDTPGLKRILRREAGEIRELAVHTFRTSRRPGVLHLLLDLLEDPHTPPALARLVGKREDRAFLCALFARAADGPSSGLARNLKRIISSDWVGKDLTWLESLDGRDQRGAIEMLLATGIPRDEVFRVIAHLGVHGTEDGRRAVATALASFASAEANLLSLTVLDDESPAVQAEALGQLRDRRLPGALPRLIELLDSPHVTVRDKARACLSEFTFPRFLAAFEFLDNDVQRSTGELVRKVDPNTLSGLTREFKAEHRERRRQALAVASAMGVLGEIEGQIISLLHDRDPQVRIAAANTLAACTSADARAALRQALVDQDPKVRLAAETSIRAMLPGAGAAYPLSGSEMQLSTGVPTAFPVVDGLSYHALSEESA